MTTTVQTLSCCLDDSMEAYTVESSTTERRNLAGAFDDLYVEQPTTLVSTPPNNPKQVTIDDSSPAGVADLELLDDDDSIPHFSLHPDLKRELSQELVNRVSFYGILHDINKEATAMAANDFCPLLRQVKSMDEEDEVHSPLIVAVKGQPSSSRPRQSLSMVETALIDEETWLLTAIEARGSRLTESEAVCPPTFLQAMGERDYETMETSRTQLWKPSRSWWEAKSGKNPWIEPKSHNKRWRYLWPLIHYHKFLAKCIKKLKRNGVDVKISVSPVAVFLREEVCAVSDHLASVSLFLSDQWMDCLQLFEGWSNATPAAEARLRTLISNLTLRPLEEPGDVESPLLRHQIDEQFLRAMVAARESMTSDPKPKSKSEEKTENTTQSTRHGLPLHPQSDRPKARATTKPRNGGTPRSKSMRSNASSGNQPHLGDGSSSSRPSSSYMYNGQQWGYNGWAPRFAVCDENTSVQSALSGDSYQQYGGYPPAHYDSNFHQMYPMQYYPHQTTPEHSVNDTYPPPAAAYYPPGFDPYNPEHALAANSGWYGPPDPNMVYAGAPPTPQQQQYEQTNAPATPGGPPSPAAPYEAGNMPEQQQQQTPYKGDYNHAVPMSPFWGHMDYQVQATLAMTGIVTPHKAPAPSSRGVKEDEEKKEHCGGEQEIDAQPLLINQPHYYPYGSAYGEAYVPPSPATQFMMSPQANSQAAAYYAAYNNAAAGGGYNHGYYHSPRRPNQRRRQKRTPPRSAKKEHDASSPPPVIRKVIATTAPETSSDSEHTAATTTESDSVAEC